MKPISCSWPVKFFNFKKDEANERFSRGKCAVFFKGETPDKRYFSDSFGEDVIKTLPYTPIVSHYDAEKDDFVGHSTEQDIYGIVDPCVEPTFEVLEDGNTWAVCDTVIYTERPDKLGEIAKKIEGHSQSLELDPKTVKYVINYDEKKHFKNVEFTAGSIIGLSVLGKEQKPAFTGSTFFSCDENFEAKMKILKDYCESQDAQTQGGNQMNLQEFMTLSWGEKSSLVTSAIEKEYGQEYFTYIVDMYEDKAIFRAYSYIDGSTKLFSIGYSLDENSEVVFGNIEEVHIVYEPVTKQEQGAENAPFENQSSEQPTEEPSTTTEVQPEVKAEEATESTVEQTFEETQTTEEPETTPETTETAEPESSTEGTQTDFSTNEQPTETGENAQPAQDASEAEVAGTADNFNAVDTQTQKVGADNEDSQEADSSSATLTESERAEFEALKREKKVNLINSFAEVLSEEETNKFMAAVDEVDYDKLNVDLLEIYKRKKEEVGKTPFRARVFAYSNQNARNQENDLLNYLNSLK